MFNSIMVLTRAQLMIARNTLWRGKIGRKIAWVLGVIALGVMAWGIYTLMSTVVAGMRSPEFAELLREAAAAAPPGTVIPTDLMPYLVALPSVAVFGALLLLVLTSFSTVLSSLYLSGDIDSLLVAPVPMRAVFVVKFFGGLVLPYLLLFLLVGPALLGFGQGMGYGAAYYLVALLVLALVPLLPFSLGALLVIAAVRVVPARRAREILGVIGGLFGVAYYILVQFTPELSDNVVSSQALSTLARFNNPLLPSAWAGRALNAAGTGDWPTLLGFGALFASVSIGAFVGALLLGERIYYQGWSNMATQGGKVKAKRQRPQPSALSPQPSPFGLPTDSAAILTKDLRVFRRDLRNVQQLIFPLAIAGIWVFRLIANPLEPVGRQDDVSALLGMLAPAGISAFVCLTLSSALGASNISREGKGFWQLKIAPVSGWRIILGKFALAYAPYPIVGTLFIVLIAVLQRSSLTDMFAALAIVLLTGLGTCAITLGMGAAFPKFDWVNPNQQTSVQAGCLAPVIYMVYLVLAVGAVIGLPLVGAFVPFGAALTVLGWAIMLALTAGVTWGFLALGARRIELIEV
ncbi:MAG: hypothetical protein H7Z42_16270 [Roseiflexaceae bacterium]|nr:hypothetical protein [Roseiflexaceae bacterium]